MNRRIVLLAVAALLLPLLIRFIWYFPGFALPRTVATPDYASLKLPEAPVSTPLPISAATSRGVVLFDDSHANQYQPGEIQSLTTALTQHGGRFVFNSDPRSLAAQLKAANGYVVLSPSMPFTSQELSLVWDFVARGGRLVVFTDATRGSTLYDYAGNPVSSQPDVDVANPLLAPYGISVNPDYLYDIAEHEGNFRNVYLASFAKSDVTSGIQKVAFYGSHSITTESGSALLVCGDSTLSSSTDSGTGEAVQPGWAAAALSQDGRVLAFGDFSFLAAPYSSVADNGLLISRIADFLLAGPRASSLADYPYVFQGRTVSLLASSRLQMTAEMTDAVSELKASLADAGTDLQLVQSAPAEGDLIVLGTYSASTSGDLAAYVRPFGVTADTFGQYVAVPPFGKLGQSGNGLLLFRTAPHGNILVLLVASASDMASLLGDVAEADFSGCLLQGNVAVCSIGFGGSFLETTPTAVPTSTPGG